jgi:hypothetical protein
MIRGQIEAAIAALNGLVVPEDSRRLTAVIVMLEEVLPEFNDIGRKPWRAVPWLDCASHLLQVMSAPGTNGAREHVSAARDLLVRE